MPVVNWSFVFIDNEKPSMFDEIINRFCFVLQNYLKCYLSNVWETILFFIFFNNSASICKNGHFSINALVLISHNYTNRTIHNVSNYELHTKHTKNKWGNITHNSYNIILVMGCPIPFKHRIQKPWWQQKYKNNNNNGYFWFFFSNNSTQFYISITKPNSSLIPYTYTYTYLCIYITICL